MAKARKPSKRKPVPLLAAAVICEKVLAERDNVNSAIRIVDTVTLPRQPEAKAGDVLKLPLHLLLILKTGRARGTWRCRLKWVSPSKKTEEAAGVSLDFSAPPEGGHVVDMPLFLKWEREGLYWFNVFIEGTLLTRVPLRVRLAEQGAPAKEANGGPPASV